MLIPCLGPHWAAEGIPLQGGRPGRVANHSRSTNVRALHLEPTTQTAMAWAGSESAIPAIELPQSYALDRTVTGNGSLTNTEFYYIFPRVNVFFFFVKLPFLSHRRRRILTADWYISHNEDLLFHKQHQMTDIYNQNVIYFLEIQTEFWNTISIDCKIRKAITLRHTYSVSTYPTTNFLPQQMYFQHNGFRRVVCE